MKKIVKFCLCIVGMLACVYLIYNHYEYQVVENQDKLPFERDGKSAEQINNLKQEYNNNEIIMYIEIPYALTIPVVQTENNEFYLNHDIYRKESSLGAVFLDYRNKSLNDRKLIIYGYNKLDKALPLSKLLDYKNEEFFKKHQNINVYTATGQKTYKIFSVYTESEDFDYVNLNGYSGLGYYEHLLKLKEKSLYDTGVGVDENSKIIIIETCALESGCSEKPVYHLVMGVEINPQP